MLIKVRKQRASWLISPPRFPTQLANCFQRTVSTNDGTQEMPTSSKLFSTATFHLAQHNPLGVAVVRTCIFFCQQNAEEPKVHVKNVKCKPQCRDQVCRNPEIMCNSRLHLSKPTLFIYISFVPLKLWMQSGNPNLCTIFLIQMVLLASSWFLSQREQKKAQLSW